MNQMFIEYGDDPNFVITYKKEENGIKKDKIVRYALNNLTIGKLNSITILHKRKRMDFYYKAFMCAMIQFICLW